MSSTSQRHSELTDSSNVLVDTSIWSLTLRRTASNLGPRDRAFTAALSHLLRADRVQLLGVVRLEVLSGISEEARFVKIRDYLQAFQDPPLEIADYETAAEMSNRSRARGIAESPIDLLICAAAYRRSWQIFSSDRDFQRYREVLGIKLFDVS